MKVSYQDARETPASVVMRDLEYMAIESQVKAMKEKKLNAKSK